MSAEHIPFRVIAIADSLERVRYVLTVARKNPGVPMGLMLRDANHQEQAVAMLVDAVRKWAVPENITLLSNSFPHTSIPYIHYTSAQLHQGGISGGGKRFGCSVHSVDDARQAEALGATYLIFGPVFPSVTKPGRAGRGVGAIRDVCESVTLPVFAVSGITAGNWPECLAAGAFGAAGISLFDPASKGELSAFLSLIRAI